MQFSDIPGLTSLKEHLVSSYKRGKIAHAQIFSGRPGTAVFPMALAYTSYLMCENRTDTDSCGTCPNCTRIQKMVHPDIHLHFPKISAADSGKLDKVLAEALPLFREFVKNTPYGDLEAWTHAYGQENKNLLISREDSRRMLKNVSMRSVEGGYKILIIWCPERMNQSSANAILKILEEPPEKTLYFLVSYNYDALLSTITSRTQLVTVPPNTEEEVKSFLMSAGSDELKAGNAAKLSEGKIGRAVQFTETDESSAYEDFQHWMKECWQKNLTALVERSEDFSKSGKASQRTSLLFSMSQLRNALVQLSGQEPPVQSEQEKQFVSNYAKAVGYENLEKIYTLINEALNHLERNSNARVTHLNLSLTILRVLNG